MFFVVDSDNDVEARKEFHDGHTYIHPVCLCCVLPLPYVHRSQCVGCGVRLPVGRVQLSVATLLRCCTLVLAAGDAAFCVDYWVATELFCDHGITSMLMSIA